MDSILPTHSPTDDGQIHDLRKHVLLKTLLMQARRRAILREYVSEQQGSPDQIHVPRKKHGTICDIIN